MVNSSKTFFKIKSCSNLKKSFRVNDVNGCCNNLLKLSPSFLSKHRVGNPSGYTEYFFRISRGLYQINNEII